MIWSSNPGRNKKFFSSSQHPNRLWEPSSTLLNGFRSSFPGVEPQNFPLPLHMNRLHNNNNNYYYYYYNKGRNKKLLLVGMKPALCSVSMLWVWFDYRLEIRHTTPTLLLCFSGAEAHFVITTVVDSWQQLWPLQWWRRAQSTRYFSPITGIF
jgi:hypothetical protein